MAAPAATQSAIQRALSAAKACGLCVTGFSVAKDGTVRVDTAPAVDSAPPKAQILEPKRWAKR